MPVPDFQTLMLPLLRFAADGKEHSVAEARGAIASEFHLTPDELAQLLPSGRAPVFANRLAWAKVYLERAGLLDSPKRAHFLITEEGRALLLNPPNRIDIKYLGRYPAFAAFRERKDESGTSEEKVTAEDATAAETPEESLEHAYSKLRGDLATEVLTRIKKAAPDFFERLVVELLLNMGYGGSRKEAGEAIGRSGDEGIDGTINEDRLGLDVIYIQAKKWENTVGRRSRSSLARFTANEHERVFS